MQPEKYSHSHITLHTVSSVSVWSYWPIAAIYVVSAVISLYTVRWHAYPDYMSHVMGFVLLFFGLVKISDIKGFAHGFAQYDPLAKRSVVYAQTYPFIEIFLGVLFIFQLLILPATLLTLCLYGASLYGALQSLFKKEALHCVCLGTYFKLPLSTVTVIEAGFMVGMCIWMLIMIKSMTMMVM